MPSAQVTDTTPFPISPIYTYSYPLTPYKPYSLYLYISCSSCSLIRESKKIQGFSRNTRRGTTREQEHKQKEHRKEGRGVFRAGFSRRFCRFCCFILLCLVPDPPAPFLSVLPAWTILQTYGNMLPELGGNPGIQKGEQTMNKSFFTLDYTPASSISADGWHS